ncbi:MAG: hypothetical protein K8R64_05065 [Methanosarcinaceae archaeon]|nr:hypothetical protein [Methanosarcinaceae archaeon]
MVDINENKSDVSTDYSEDFNQWRKEWLVQKAKERHFQEHKELKSYSDDGFWKWYIEKHQKINNKNTHLYSDITAKECRNLDKGEGYDLDHIKKELDFIRQDFIQHDMRTIDQIVDGLQKIGMKKEASEFISTVPLSKDTLGTLDRFFDALHQKGFNDAQIVDFYMSLTSDERLSLGCNP